MFDSIDQIKNLPIVLIMYPAGASGEFLATALTESFPNIAKTNAHQEGPNRFKYLDVFDRTLTSGIDFNKDDIIAGINNFLYQNNPQGQIMLGLAHPTMFNKQFIFNYLSMLPVIEITTKNEKSKKFMVKALGAKITHKVISDIQKRIFYQYKESYISNKDILKIEWEELFLSDTTNQFTRIEEFLKLTGSVEEFRSLVSK